jgi:hypothetical protein
VLELDVSNYNSGRLVAYFVRSYYLLGGYWVLSPCYADVFGEMLAI